MGGGGGWWWWWCKVIFMLNPDLVELRLRWGFDNKIWKVGGFGESKSYAVFYVYKVLSVSVSHTFLKRRRDKHF